MADRRTGLPAFDLPGIVPISAASFSSSPAGLVPAEWVFVCDRRGAHFVRLSATPPLAGHRFGLLLPGYGRHLAGTGPTGGVRHFPGGDRKLSLSPWPPGTTWRILLFAKPRGQAPDRGPYRPLFPGTENLLAIRRRCTDGR